MTSLVAPVRDIVVSQNPLATAVLTTLLRPLHARAWLLRVRPDNLHSLRAAARHGALVFLPAHRSYADPPVLAAAVRTLGLPRNYLISGRNLSFWPFGPLGRRAGVVFLRRTFHTDDSYKLAVRAYLTHLLAEGHNIEWYPEGSRSRTGRVGPPRYGLLRYAVDAICERHVADACLVPVALTYDVLPEAAELAAEQIGAVKPPEDMRWITRYLHRHRRRVGQVEVRFGAPLPISSAFAADASADARDATRRLASKVLWETTRLTPVTPTALLALALPPAAPEGLRTGDLTRAVGALLRQVTCRRLPHTDLSALRDDRGARSVLDRLEREGVLLRRKDYVMPVSAHLAAYYRNLCSHWWLARSVTEVLVLQAFNRPPSDRLTGFETGARYLHRLLRHEFTLPDLAVFQSALDRELGHLDPRWQETTELTELRKILTDTGCMFAHRVLLPVVTAYGIAADELAAQPAGHALDADRFVDACMTRGLRYRETRQVFTPEAVSTTLFRNATAALSAMDLLGCDRGGSPRELIRRRQACATGLCVLADAAETTADWDLTYARSGLDDH